MVSKVKEIQETLDIISGYQERGDFVDAGAYLVKRGYMIVKYLEELTKIVSINDASRRPFLAEEVEECKQKLRQIETLCQDTYPITSTELSESIIRIINT